VNFEFCKVFCLFLKLSQPLEIYFTAKGIECSQNETKHIPEIHDWPAV